MMKAMMRIAYDWGVRCFGVDHMENLQIRSTRLAEEAIELLQATDVPKSQALLLVDIIYNRPKGDLQQEIGGILLSIAVLCQRLGLDLEQTFEMELRRVLQKSPEHFTRREQEKLDLGLTGSPSADCSPGSSAQ